MNLKTMLLLLTSILCLASCGSDKTEDEPHSKREINYSKETTYVYPFPTIVSQCITPPADGGDYFILNSKADIEDLPDNILPERVRGILTGTTFRHTSILLVRRYLSETIMFQSMEDIRMYKIDESKIEINFYCYNQTPVTPDTDLETTVIDYYPFEISQIPKDTEVTIIEKYKDM